MTTQPVQKNDTLEVTFTDLSHDGAGVAKVKGYTLFVPGGLPGEAAEVKVIKTKKGYGFGKLIKFIETSEDRVEPPCEIFDRCGGCQIQHLNPKGQAQFKYKMVTDALERLGGLKEIKVHPVLTMDHPWAYRNKASVPVASREGELIAGFYQKRSHFIIDMDHCLITDDTVDEVIQEVKRIAKDSGIEPYNEETHKGILRHIIVRVGKQTDEVMVVLVTKTDELPFRKRFIKELPEKFPQIKSIAQNINKKRTNTIFGNETRILWGKETILDTIGSVKFAISPRSFYQVNPEQTRVLYEKAMEYAELAGKETVIDAYCGIGTISLFLAQKAGQVYGVEIVPEAIEDARKNAELNELTNVTFEAGPAEEVIPNWYKQGIKADIVVVDPPRKGCDEALLQTILEMKPKRVVYVSCNPATLARDLRVLEDGGYKTIEVQPVDMFPQTMHCEAVAKIEL
ncbi:23S rRNA (uracil(1939)-C(5))-methyltransferase RlmD [Pullulanibacillus sp. KACC 23026]|uniref:23S rRNA (uracil(1939)-C(5))-methyltransferase RlmD n=1 Tax=Pullulanibacillus sp. KACC 23026 TaxID=3028315 RepID=UPI0023B17C86|nr:23S rRNA (uracil(1939)-C(5))-methyltransferase RlmD [Pullulanibacillus sp. KACC 23026]WEG12367.1 23S rRNA (uracil(1939)-C(5))-methyltransferase RlmD [Pullulanibacillus sp. KACC 23026]